MKFEEAFKKIIFAGIDIEAVCNCDYLYQIEGINKPLTEEEVVNYASELEA